MKYDDASWHYGADNFPKDLAEESGATHAGMFVAWALLSGLAGSIHIEDFPDDIPKLASRSVTPGVFFLEACDGKFTDEDLNEEGNSFASDYFEFEKGQYLADYESILGEPGRDLYYVADTWENFDRLRPVLDKRFAEWKARNG
ncbi:hypothetical protein [Steroidobacter cummioxidans]|uniref:DUF7832 domain-containing protein n=1 Tax=Steroidobacter cummioxidans TaxID=1803913 RepID=UPI000E31E5A2|nr:hypothetical protein [Steroidobacter cummioxidans]